MRVMLRRPADHPGVVAQAWNPICGRLGRKTEAEGRVGQEEEGSRGRVGEKIFTTRKTSTAHKTISPMFFF